MSEKLTMAQERALTILADARHELSHAGLHVDGISGSAMRALERRGYVTSTAYANGVHFGITEAGRLALIPPAIPTAGHTSYERDEDDGLRNR